MGRRGVESASLYKGCAADTDKSRACRVLLVVAYAVAGWLSGEAVPGWASLMVVVLILGSAQLLMIGLLGEYLGRAYIESKRRPLFIIDRVVRQQSVADQGPVVP